MRPPLDKARINPALHAANIAGTRACAYVARLRASPRTADPHTNSVQQPRISLRAVRDVCQLRLDLRISDKEKIVKNLPNCGQVASEDRYVRRLCSFGLSHGLVSPGFYQNLSPFRA